jgi:hypothetical protein
MRLKMNEAEVVSELADRIQRDLDFFHGAMPERSAIAWRGYLAGILEWGVLNPAGHDRLVALLPDIVDDPVRDILLGREE